MNALGTTPIFQNRTFYVPRFELYLGNRPERGALLHDVMEVSYKDDINAIDTFDFTLNNWDAEKRTFKHHDSERLNPEQPVRLHMGYLDDKNGVRLMIQGRITSMAPTFPAGGQPTVKIGGQNVLNSFCQQQRSETYEDMTASSIAEKVCQRLGVLFENSLGKLPNTEFQYPHLMQVNQFDIVFLMQLARSEGYEIVVEEGQNGSKTKLKFVQPSTVGRVVYELRYGATLIEFTPSLEVAKQVSKVEVNGWDEAKGKPIKVEVGQQHLGANAGLKARMLPSAKNVAADRKEVISKTPARNQQEAMAIAKSALEEKNQMVITGSGSTIGIPELRAGSHLYLWGLGKRFSGRYFVTSTTHSIGMSGYKTQFSCRLEELAEEPRKEHP